MKDKNMNNNLNISLLKNELSELKKSHKGFNKLIESLKRKRKHDLSIEDMSLIKIYDERKKYLNKLKREITWLEELRDESIIFEQLNSNLNNENKIFCMDLEMHEYSGKTIEVGVSIFEKGILKTYHFIVKERLKSTNGKRVPNNKHKFVFGDSEILTMQEIREKVFELVKDCDFLSGHSFENDIHFLQECGYKNRNIKILDTQYYARFLFKENRQISLGKIIEKVLEEEGQYLHNGGNDSHYTLRCLLEMGKTKYIEK